MHLTHATVCIMLQISLEWAYWNIHMNLMFTFFVTFHVMGDIASI